MKVKVCPNCGNENHPSEPFCCGISLGPIALSEAGAAVQGEGSCLDNEPRPWSENRLCPDPDCQYENRPDAETCLYCNSPLVPEGHSAPTPEAPSASGGVGCPTLNWPWGPTPIGERFPIGRDPDFSPELHGDLADFKNVSGFHAEIRQRDGGLYLTDLDSTNGTFINERPLSPHIPEILHPGDEIRFAKDLRARYSV